MSNIVAPDKTIRLITHNFKLLRIHFDDYLRAHISSSGSPAATRLSTFKPLFLPAERNDRQRINDIPVKSFLITIVYESAQPNVAFTIGAEWKARLDFRH